MCPVENLIGQLTRMNSGSKRSVELKILHRIAYRIKFRTDHTLILIWVYLFVRICRSTAHIVICDACVCSNMVTELHDIAIHSAIKLIVDHCSSSVRASRMCQYLEKRSIAPMWRSPHEFIVLIYVSHWEGQLANVTI